MRILIAGLGSIGKRHAGLIREHFGHELCALRSGNSAKGNTLGIKEVYDWGGAASFRPDAAIISNPTAMHIPAALECARMGAHIFMEKPIAHNMDGVEELEKICGEKGSTCYVAYCMRFHPVMEKMKELMKKRIARHVRAVCSSFLPEWRSVSDWRRSYSSANDMGGGVILDLSHEFDYIEYLFSPIKEMTGSYGRISNITVDAEDYADILMTLDDGAKVNLYINFMSRSLERYALIDTEDGYIRGDFFNRTVQCRFSDDEISYKCGDTDMYLEQLKYFFNNLGNKRIMNNIGEAKVLFKKIVDFKVRASG